MSIDPALLEIFACPQCHAPLREEPVQESARTPAQDPAADSELVCTSADCGLAYPVRDGIPVLLVDEARRPA